MINVKQFVPISVDEYLTLFMNYNPGENRKVLEKELQDVLAYALADKKCTCGNTIWVIGAVHAGYKCFTCISGEASPDGDYEIDQHIQHLTRSRY